MENGVLVEGFTLLERLDWSGMRLESMSALFVPPLPFFIFFQIVRNTSLSSKTVCYGILFTNLQGYDSPLMEFT